MNLDKSKQIPIIIILSVSFLIEFPLRTTIISALYFAMPLNHIIISIIFYAALFACLLTLLKPNIALKSVLKSLCVVVAFWIFEELMSIFFSNIHFVLVYEITRPALIFGAVLWAAHWVLKSKININKVFLFIAGGLLSLRTVLTVLEYLRTIVTMQNIENDPSSYLQSLTMSGSGYTMLAGLSTYALVCIMLIFIQDSIPAKVDCENTDN